MERAATWGIKRLAVVGAAVVSLTACNPVRPYVPPTGADTAKLLIRPTIPNGMKFGLFTYEDAHACGNLQQIVIGDSSTGNQSSTLRAGPLTTLKFLASEGTLSCAIVFSFYPKARHRYLLLASQDQTRCAVRFMDATDGDNPHPDKTFVKRTVRGSGCAPMNTNVRSGEPIDAISQGTQEHGPSNGANDLSDFKDLLPK